MRGATDFAGMTDIAKELRAELAQASRWRGREIVTEQVSADGTRKWLLRLDDGKEVETVYIPEADRGTLCISSQVGCTLTCSFCHTGTQKLVRNLTPAEIVGQIMLARDRLGDWPGASAEDPRGIPDAERKITNVVLMGMGEPLYNFDNVRDAMRDRRRRRGAVGLQAAHHAVDLRHRAGNSALGRGGGHHARHLAACGARRAARPARAHQQEMADARNCSTPAAPIPASPTPSASPSNM